jgi:hypothetical protein
MASMPADAGDNSYTANRSWAGFYMGRHVGVGLQDDDERRATVNGGGGGGGGGGGTGGCLTTIGD